MMNHFYQKISGIMNYESYFIEAVKNAKNGDLFVQIGCFLGKSTVFLATEIINSGKKIQLHVIDQFDYNDYDITYKGLYNSSHEVQQQEKKYLEGKNVSVSYTPFEIFQSNIDPIKNKIKYFRGISRMFIKNYIDQSVDFLFIDDNRSLNLLNEDLKLWYPKVKNNSIMSGYNYTKVEVKKNIDEFFQEDIYELDYQPHTIWRVFKGDFSSERIVSSKINLNLNWKKTNKKYSFVTGQIYSLPLEIVYYLKTLYKNEFEILPKKEKTVNNSTNQQFNKLRGNFIKPNLGGKVLWTVGIVNYKSIEFMKYQLKSLYKHNSLPFKLIIVDNSIPNEDEQLREICKNYENVTIIKNDPNEIATSAQHSEGLKIILKIVDTKYLLINDPDFFWVQNEYLYTLQTMMEKGNVCVGAPWYSCAYPEEKTPALWGCAYDTSILDDDDFYSHEGCSVETIRKMVREGKDTGWKLREKFKKQNLKTLSFEDHLGISIKNEFDKIEEHFPNTTSKDIHEYSYNGKIIAYHLCHGCHETEESFPTFDTRKKSPAKSKWSDVRAKYLNFFSKIIENEKQLKIHLHFPVKNEEKILPYFFKHYDRFVEKYFAHYNIHSKDKTLDILKQKYNVKIIEYFNEKIDDRIYLEIKNNIWKKYSNPENCDWVIICDSDEFLYHEDLLNKIIDYEEKCINIPKIKGYQMFYDNEIPNKKNKQLYEIVNFGIEADNYSKFVLIKPYLDPNYGYGAHMINPKSNDNFIFSDNLSIDNKSRAELKLLHYKIFGKNFIKQMYNRNKELSEFNINEGLGIYNYKQQDILNPENEYNYIKENAKKIL